MINLLKFLKKITFDSNAFAFRKLVAPWPKRRKRKVICSLIDEVISVLGVSLQPNERTAAHSNLAITIILHH